MLEKTDSVIQFPQTFLTLVRNEFTYFIYAKFLLQNLPRPKKKICGIPVSSYKNLGRVGRF